MAGLHLPWGCRQIFSILNHMTCAHSGHAYMRPHVRLDAVRRSAPGELGVQAGCRVDDGGEQERKGGANGGLSGQLREEVGRHAVAALGALALHDQALLGEHVQALHQAAHGCIDGTHLHRRQGEGSQHA